MIGLRSITEEVKKVIISRCFSKAMEILLYPQYKSIINQKCVNTLLEYATVYNSLELVRFLIENSELPYNAHLTKEDYFPLISCAISGKIEIARYFLTHRVFFNKGVKTIPDIQWKNNELLIYACKQQQLEFVRFLLTDPDLKRHANIHARKEMALQCACKSGDLKLVEYLLCSPELKDHAKIKSNKDAALNYACISANKEVIEFLLTSPKLKEHAKISVGNCTGLCNFIFFYHNKKHNLQEFLDIVDYLLLYPQVNQYMHANKNMFFQNVYNSENIDVFKHLIFNHNFTITPEIKKLITANNLGLYSNPDLDQLFTLKETNDNLQSSLQTNKSNSTRMKI